MHSWMQMRDALIIVSVPIGNQHADLVIMIVDT